MEYELANVHKKLVEHMYAASEKAVNGDDTYAVVVGFSNQRVDASILLRR